MPQEQRVCQLRWHVNGLWMDDQARGTQPTMHRFGSKLFFPTRTTVMHTKTQNGSITSHICEQPNVSAL